MTIVYTYSGCDTCRRALKWLRARGIELSEKPIRATPPSPAELAAMLEHQGGQLRRLFNTSGQDYRAAGLKDSLPSLLPAQAIALLAANGNLVKRPFVLGPGFGLVGFDEDQWSRAFA